MSKKLLVAMQSGGGWYTSDDDFGMKRAKDCGLEAIDYNIDHVINVGQYLAGREFPRCDLPVDEFVESYSALKQASEKYGVKVDQMHAPYPIYIKDNPKATDYLIALVEKIMAVCQYVGCTQLTVHPFGTIFPDENFNKQDDLDINLEMYQRLIPSAKKYGVKICLENLMAVRMEGEKEIIIPGICADADDAVYLVDTLNNIAGEEIFGFCFDVGHLNACGLDVYSFIKKLGKRITALHIHDNDGTKDAHEIPYTQCAGAWGEKLGIDWEGYINGLKEVGYSGCLAFEAFRATRYMPADCTDDVLKLISSIGRYFRKRISE